MTGAKAKPSFEDFKTAVRKYFKVSWPDLDDQAVNAYLDSDEAMFEINHRYEETLEEFNAGKATLKEFMVGVASSVGYCLSLMY